MVRDLRWEITVRLVIGAAIAFAAIHLACGGVNMSDDHRSAGRNAATPSNDDADDDEDAGTDDEPSPTPAPAPTPAPPDAGTSNEAAAPAPVPAGSFAAGSDLETTANLNLRDGPGTDFAVLATMPAATLVKVKTTSGADGWVHLDYQGTLGYASKTFLKVP